MKVLITGGAGYIGAITAKALEEAGHRPVILDSLISGPRQFVFDRPFYAGDVADRALLRTVFAEHDDLDCVIHMAARIVVPESVRLPYLYYRDNVSKSIELFDELANLGCPRIVFSSTAAVYGTGPTGSEVSEDAPVVPSSPYGRTKHAVELALEDITRATDLRAVILRYFNPVGSAPDLSSGAYVRKPTHVVGQLTMAALGQIDGFTLTGTTWPTSDGTGIRDYMHVWDLARAHVAAVERFDEACTPADRSVTLNVGTGTPVTVGELVSLFERVLGRALDVRHVGPRPGDTMGSYANVDRARDLLRWSAQHGLDEAIESALAWSRIRSTVLGYA